MQTRLEKIDFELKKNTETTKIIKEKLKSAKKDLELAKATGATKEELEPIFEAFQLLDKQYNDLRSDFYFLNAERMEEAKKGGAGVN